MKTFSAVVAALCLFCPTAISSPESHWVFSTDPSGAILDFAGRTRVFHGVNAVEKEAPYIPTTGEFNTENSLTEQDAEILSNMGMTIVRLGVMWPAVMPEKDMVNTTYLDGIKSMIEMLSSYGIGTLVDLHQDVLSPYLCGEGMPDWVFQRALELVNFDSSKYGFPFPLPFDIPIDDTTGKPDISSCQQFSFFEYYLSLESEAAWHALYSEPEIWGYFADHWGAVASHLKGTDGLVGYELLNEPWPSKGTNNSWRVLSDSHTLLTLYQTAHNQIRSFDQDTLVFFEPLVLESYEAALGRKTDFPVGGPGGEEYANKSVFAYHSYCSSNATSGAPSPMGLCKALIKTIWRGTKKNIQKLGTGGFLTEFGAVGNDDDSLELIRLQAEGADELFQGWAYWTYKSFDDITTQNSATETFFNEDGTVQTAKVKALSRTYAKAIAGAPVSMSFDPTSSDFSLEYTVSESVSSNKTIVYLSTEHYYPNGYQVSLSPESGVEWSVKQSTDSMQLLQVTHDSATLDAGTAILVKISAE